jgi:uncharacterized membrane protein
MAQHAIDRFTHHKGDVEQRPKGKPRAEVGRRVMMVVVLVAFAVPVPVPVSMIVIMAGMPMIVPMVVVPMVSMAGVIVVRGIGVAHRKAA